MTSYGLGAHFAPVVDRGPGEYNPAFLCGLYGDGTVAATVPRSCLPRDREADRARLVEASKSPTSEAAADFEGVAGSVEELQGLHDRFLINKKTGVIVEHVRDKPTPEKQAGCYAVTEFRWWSDEYRVRTEVRGAVVEPEACWGERATWMLTDRGARKIADSCQYVALQYGGFNTFLTLTFDAERRAQIASGELTIQREVSRFCDGMQKAYQRDGWGERMGCTSLLYCWVVEIPKNAEGEQNPHVHMLLRWSVKKAEFSAWSERVEKIWGHGFAHLEKIDDPKAAGAYMAKAAGYMTKAAGQDDQGRVVGNRYGISKEARAPGWCVVEESELGAMGMLIAELHDHMTEKFGSLYRARKELGEARERTPKSATWKRSRIAEKLAAVRKELAALPVRAGKYVATFKGRKALQDFKDWCAGQVRVVVSDADKWLPEKLPTVQQAGTDRPDSMWIVRLRRAMEWRKRCRRAWDQKAIEACDEHMARCKADMLRYWCMSDLEWSVMMA